MNDFSGTSAPGEEKQQEENTTSDSLNTSSTDRAAALNLQELAARSNGECLEVSSVSPLRHHDAVQPWAQEWQYWGDEHLMPFDFNMDFSLGQDFS